MHIPDGFLNTPTVLASGAIAVASVGVALRIVGKTFPARRVPLIGLAAAFVFAAQMINFPVAGGTSGHLIGGVLAAVLLGPSAAVLVMTCVLVLQCFMFADGGVTALGANVLNLAVVAPVVGYAIYRATCKLSGGGLRGMLVGTAFGAWCSTVAASVVCAGELAFSGSAAWGVALPAMVWMHMIIGLGEALITTLVIAVVAQLRPELLLDGDKPVSHAGYRELLGYGVLASLGLAIFVAPFACGWPDGLEKVAQRLGIEHLAQAPLVGWPFADYATPYVSSAVISTGLAGCAGAVVVFGLAWLLARAVMLKPIVERNSCGQNQ